MILMLEIRYECSQNDLRREIREERYSFTQYFEQTKQRTPFGSSPRADSYAQ